MYRSIRILATMLLMMAAWVYRPVRADAAPYGQDPIIDSPMFTDPLFTQKFSEEWFFDKAVLDLWSKSLDHREVELRRRICDTITEARVRGVKDVVQLLPRLTALLEEDNLDPLVRSAAIRAVSTIDDKSAGALLSRFTKTASLEEAILIDSALARWAHEPAIVEWRARATDDRQSLVLRRSAIRALGVVRDAQSAAPLQEMVAGRRAPSAIRLAAAQALGAIVATGLEPLADSLAPAIVAVAVTAAEPEGAILDHLMAAHLLARHDSPAARVTLGRLARSTEPAIALMATRRLVDLDPRAVASDLAPQQLKSPDASLRELAIDVVSSFRQPESVGLLAPLLDDPSPALRIKVREWMVACHEMPALRSLVLDASKRMLASRSWRGLEQAALVVGKVKDQDACPRLVELMAADRPEVRLAACAALRWVALPSTLPAVLERAKRLVEMEKEHMRTAQTQQTAKPGDDDPRVLSPFITMENELAQLNQMMGQMRYYDAEAFLRTFVPIPTVIVSAPGNDSRAAAIWSLGLLLEGKDDVELAAKLAARILDQPKEPPQPPIESASVYHTAALTIGRMKSKSQLPVLRRFYKEGGGAATGWIGACRWAIMQITGEELPVPPDVVSRQTASGWLLEPSPPKQ